jgi:chromosome segregation ATPase
MSTLTELSERLKPFRRALEDLDEAAHLTQQHENAMREIPEQLDVMRTERNRLKGEVASLRKRAADLKAHVEEVRVITEHQVAEMHQACSATLAALQEDMVARQDEVSAEAARLQEEHEAYMRTLSKAEEDAQKDLDKLREQLRHTKSLLQSMVNNA